MENQANQEDNLNEREVKLDLDSSISDDFKPSCKLYNFRYFNCKHYKSWSPTKSGWFILLES